MQTQAAKPARRSALETTQAGSSATRLQRFALSISQSEGSKRSPKELVLRGTFSSAGGLRSRCLAGGRTAHSHGPARSAGRNRSHVRRSHSASAAGMPACAPRWARSETPTTTPCAKASSPRWNANCSTGSRFKTQAEARIAVFDFIEGFYNPRRRHSFAAWRM
jgi:hypothetical protein